MLTLKSSPVIPRLRRMGEITKEGIKRETEREDQNKIGTSKQQTYC